MDKSSEFNILLHVRKERKSRKPVRPKPRPCWTVPPRPITANRRNNRKGRFATPVRQFEDAIDNNNNSNSKVTAKRKNMSVWKLKEKEKPLKLWPSSREPSSLVGCLSSSWPWSWPCLRTGISTLTWYRFFSGWDISTPLSIRLSIRYSVRNSGKLLSAFCAENLRPIIIIIGRGICSSLIAAKIQPSSPSVSYPQTRFSIPSSYSILFVIPTSFLVQLVYQIFC